MNSTSFSLHNSTRCKLILFAQHKTRILFKYNIIFMRKSFGIWVTHGIKLIQRKNRLAQATLAKQISFFFFYQNLNFLNKYFFVASQSKIYFKLVDLICNFFFN